MSYVNLSTIETKIDGILTNYVYSADLASNAYFVPPAQSIIMGGTLGTVNKLEIYFSVFLTMAPISTGDHGFVGCVHCDGTNQKFKNTHTSTTGIYLQGVSYV